MKIPSISTLQNTNSRQLAESGSPICTRVNKGGIARRMTSNFIPRPKNKWMIFLTEYTARNAGGIHKRTEICKAASVIWNGMSRQEKEVYVNKALIEKKKHSEQYPDYKYLPKKAVKSVKSVKSVESEREGKRVKIFSLFYSENGYFKPVVFDALDSKSVKKTKAQVYQYALSEKKMEKTYQTKNDVCIIEKSGAYAKHLENNQAGQILCNGEFVSVEDINVQNSAEKCLEALLPFGVETEQELPDICNVESSLPILGNFTDSLFTAPTNSTINRQLSVCDSLSSSGNNQMAEYSFNQSGKNNYLSSPECLIDSQQYDHNYYGCPKTDNESLRKNYQRLLNIVSKL